MTSSTPESPVGIDDQPPWITPAELGRHDGTRARAYAAIDGVVYDVSQSPEWRSGLHRNLHWAGQDLTSELADAPHGIETVRRCPVVGRLRPPASKSNL